jgi:hypothetical protein
MNVDLAKTIIAKSDQLNADDLLGGPIDITITRVRGCDEPDQPVAIHYEGDEGKPFKPCKTMRRALVKAWGLEAEKFVGRRLRLFCDPNVQFGGMKVGGIRISHMSHIERELEMALMVTKGRKAIYKVKPLQADVKPGPQVQNRTQAGGEQLTLAQRADTYEKRVEQASSTVKLKAILAAAEQLMADLDAGDPERKVELVQLWRARFDELEEQERAAG